MDCQPCDGCGVAFVDVRGLAVAGQRVSLAGLRACRRFYVLPVASVVEAQLQPASCHPAPITIHCCSCHLA
jgi:hypothetical protein